MHLVEIVIDDCILQRTEKHFGAFCENTFQIAGAVDQTDCGNDIMRFAGKRFNDIERVRAAGRFADHAVFKFNDRVRSDDKIMRIISGDGMGFGDGVEQGDAVSTRINIGRILSI